MRAAPPTNDGSVTCSAIAETVNGYRVPVRHIDAQICRPIRDEDRAPAMTSLFLFVAGEKAKPELKLRLRTVC
jgi:hypothetical protein